MAANGVIKRLEWLIFNFPVTKNPKDEIERLSNCINLYCQDAVGEINRQNAEIERLQEENLKLFQKMHHIRAEAIKEFADKITEVFLRYAHLHSHADCAQKDYIKAVDGTEIEMQSVWDVFALKKYEMAEYEEMSRLQKNIETIATEILLAGLEKNFKLLVKEMVGDGSVEK